MGAQAPQPSGGSNSARRAKPFIMDDQTRFLYLILKQLDLKIVNWQQVADDLGIKNGHAARMRWSRFRGHVEGAHAANNKKKDERKGNGVNAKNPMATKRIGIEPGQDEENDSKRVKTEQGWASVPGAYGQPPPPPPPPYYPVDPSYGMMGAHPPSFGAVPLSHFGLQPHAGFQSQALSQNLGPALLPAAPLNADNMIHSGIPALVKPEPGSPPALQPPASVKDEPRDEPCSNDEPCTVMFKVEKDRDISEPAGSSSTIDKESLQHNQTPKPEAASALPAAGASIGPSASGDDATCTTANDQQYIKSESEQESLDDTFPETRPLVSEVSKEDFTKAVDTVASTHAPVIDSQKAGSPRQEEPSSPEIPLATIKAQALRQQAASVESPSSTQVQTVASDTVARAESDELAGRGTPAPSKQTQSTPAANVSGHQSPPSSYADSLPPPPVKAFSPQGSAPPILAAAAAGPSPAVAQHLFPAPYMLPHGSYFHSPFPNTQTPHPLSHTYWPHPPIMHMNNPSPSPYPLAHPPLSAPPTMIPDWNDSGYHFGNALYQPAAAATAATAAHDYGRQTMSAPASQTNFNLGPLITMSGSQEQDRGTPATAAIDLTNAGSGLKTTSSDTAANMDMFGSSIEDFDPLGFDFRLGKDTGTDMSLRMESRPMEPQYVQPVSEGNGNTEHGERESGKEDSNGNEKENDGEMGEKPSNRVL